MFPTINPCENWLLIPTLVYPGDEITSIYTLEQSTGNWSNAWSYAPGDIGRAAGTVPASDGLLFDLSSEDREFFAFDFCI